MNKKDYNFREASWKFVALKGIEALGIFLIIYGFYFLGLYINGFNGEGNCGLGFWKCPYTASASAVSMWGLGILAFIFILCALVVWFFILAIIALVIFLIIWINWEWAKRWAETTEGRKKRLRRKQGFVEGDRVKVEKGLEVGEYYNEMKFIERMKKYEGKAAKITEVIKDDEGDYQFELDIDKGEFKWTKDMLERWNPKK